LGTRRVDGRRPRSVGGPAAGRQGLSAVCARGHVPRASVVAAQAAALSALGLALAPFLWFPVFGTKAYPGQHLVNVLAGVLMGPLYSAIVPVVVGTVRVMLGIGTVFAYPGGIPGAVLVGLAHRYVTSKLRSPYLKFASAFAEPVGTVLIGGTLSVLVLGPALGHEGILALLSSRGTLGALLAFWLAWSLSSVPGAALGYAVVLALCRALPFLFER